MVGDIFIRLLEEQDINIIEASFKSQGWDKPAEQYKKYLEQQVNNERLVFVAFIDGLFCGYGTVRWQSNYLYFKENNIPEISDLNVLYKYQCLGVGSKLIKIAEHEIFSKHDTVGIGVGLFSNYGPAQRLYYNLGYKPDGLGITYKDKRCEYGEEVIVGDSLVLWMTKAKQENVRELNEQG